MYDIVIKMSTSHIVLPFPLRTQLGGFVCRYILIYDAFRPRESQPPFWAKRKYTGTLGKRDKSQWCAEKCTTQKCVRSMRWDVHRAFSISHWWRGWTTDQSMGWRRRHFSIQREIVQVYSTKSALFSVCVCVDESVRHARKSCKKKGLKGQVDTEWWQPSTSHLALGSNH